MGCPNTIWKDQLRKEAGEMGHILIQAPLDSVSFLKSHYQTESHFAYGFQILPPPDLNTCTNMDDGS